MPPRRSSRPSAAKNIVASAAGISVGTLAFSAAYGALNAGIELFVDITGKAIERADRIPERVGQDHVRSGRPDSSNERCFGRDYRRS